MPIGAVGAGVIATGASLLGSGLSSWGAGKMNRKTREWSEHMYGRQRADALADWAMMNEYNSPAAQMQRFKDAGLNPNLIYGQMHDTSPVRSSNAQNWSPENVFSGNMIGDAVGKYFDVQLRKQQVDNMELQRQVMQAEIIQKLAGADSLVAGTAGKLFDLGIKTETREEILDTIREKLDNLRADTSLKQTRNTVEWTLGMRRIDLAIQQHMNMKLDAAKTEAERERILAATELLRSEKVIKEFEIELNKRGFTKGDKLPYRMLAQIAEKLGIEW